MIDGVAPADAFKQVENNLLGGEYNLDNSIQEQPPSALNIDDGSLIIEDESIESTLIDLSYRAKLDPDAKIMSDLMQNVSDIDTEHKQILNRVMDWPNFNEYLESRNITLNGRDLNENNMGITHISNVDDSILEVREPVTAKDIVEQSRIQLQEGIERQRDFKEAGIEFTQDSARWSINTNFWLTKVKVLTAAVSQLNNGLKTLFTSQ